MFTQAKRKRQHMGDLKIVVAGCVASQEGSALLRRIPEVDLVMGPQHANRYYSVLEYVKLPSSDQILKERSVEAKLFYTC